MYSKNNEDVCGLCVFAENVKGIETHISCKKSSGYFKKSRPGCELYRYDIFKRPVRRKKQEPFGNFSPEDFTL